MQRYDISTVHVGSAIKQDSGDFIRNVYIKFNIESPVLVGDSLFQNFDDFTSELCPDDKPTELMRKSIQTYPHGISQPANGMIIILCATCVGTLFP